jgi:hypothetical protein
MIRQPYLKALLVLAGLRRPASARRNKTQSNTAVTNRLRAKHAISIPTNGTITYFVVPYRRWPPSESGLHYLGENLRWRFHRRA